MGGFIDSYRRFTQWGENLSPAKNALLAALIAFFVSLGLSSVFGGSLMIVVFISVGFGLGTFAVKVSDNRD